MPNWKKVITSGSDAALRTLEVSKQFTANGTGSLNLSGSFVFTGSVTVSVNVVANSFTGSLQGTGSWARNALTASSLPVGTYQITSSWATNALTASFAPDYLLTSSFNSWTGSVSSQFSGTSSYANFTRVGRISGSLPGTVEDGTTYILPFYRSGNAPFGSTGSIYAVPIVSSTGLLHYSSSIDRLLTTASWAVNAVTASYALTAPGVTPEGNTNEIQYNVDGTNFGGVSTLTYDGSTLTGTGRFDGNLRLGLYRGTRINVPQIVNDTDEALVYSQYIPAGTFTDDDIMRVRWRIQNQSKQTPSYYIYMANTGDFSNVSGSAANIIAFCTGSTNSISYLQLKRDFSFVTSTGRIEFIRSSVPFITDDIQYINATLTGSFAMDWANSDYWMFFSAKPAANDHNCVSMYYSIERV